MNYIPNKIYILIIFLIILFSNNVFTQESSDNTPWKTELQILLGFSDEEVDGRMGLETFNALKRFAYRHDLTDVVLRGEFEDIEFWGFEQYLIKYHAYWIREIKNQRIFQDVHNKEYLRQADETLYSFEISIQNAKLEIQRLAQAKRRAELIAQEAQEMQEWKFEKKEAERVTAELLQAILTAEVEVDKWSLERLRAKRFAAEKKQLDRLNVRKAEASRLTYELEDIILSAKNEIDRLIDENNKMKELIESTEKTKDMTEEIIERLSAAEYDLSKTTESLKATQNQIDTLSLRNDIISSHNDTLTKELKVARTEFLEYKKDIEDDRSKNKDSLDTLKQDDKWYENIGLSMNVDFLSNSGELEIAPAFIIDYHHHFQTKFFKKEMNWAMILEYSPSYTFESSKNQLLSIAIQNRRPFFHDNAKWNLSLGMTNLTDAETSSTKYISFSPFELEYKLPKYKFITSYLLLSFQLMKSMDGSDAPATFLQMGLRFSID